MSETPTDAPVTAKVPSAAEFLATIPNSPTPSDIEKWKKEVPGGRVRMFSPDGERVFILRGLTGFELGQLADATPKSLPPEEREEALSEKLVAKALLWTNTTPSGKIEDPSTLKHTTFGLPVALRTVVEDLSDMIPPERLFTMVADL